MQCWQRRHAKIGRCVRVAAIEYCESDRSATLPPTHAFAYDHSQLVPLASGTYSKFLGVATTNDAPFAVDALVHGKVVLALVLAFAGETRCQWFVSCFRAFVEMVLHT